MRKLIIILLILALLPSCVRESSRSDAFELSFTLDTPTVHDGESFSFTVRSNRERVKVVRFSFPLDEAFVSADSFLEIKDGALTVSRAVSVPASQHGRLEITLEDPETGLRKDFSESYTAYSSAGVSLLIGNEPIRSAMLSSGLPAVVSGDDFLITVRTKAPRLILKDFRSEFNDGTLSIGRELIAEDGEVSLRIPSVSAEDGFTPRTLSLTLLDPDSGKDTTVTAQYVTAAAFAPSASLSPEILLEGALASVTFRSNRETFSLDGYSAPSWFVLKDYSEDRPGMTLGLDGTISLETGALDITEDCSGEILFNLCDSDCTLRKVRLSVPYEARRKTSPGTIFLSKTNLKIAVGETVSVDVSTTTPNSTGRFTARIVSGDASSIGLYAPTSSSETPTGVSSTKFRGEATVTGGRLFIRGLSGWGDVTVRVSAEGASSVYKDIKIYLRRDVALRIKGSFYDYICWWPDVLDPAFSNLGNGTQGIGWWGMPSAVEAELVSWENRSGKDITSLKKDEVATYLKCFSLADGSTSPLDVSFIVSVGNRVTSNFFYGAYKGYDDPLTRLLTGPDISRVVSETRPSSLNSAVTENRAYGNKVACKRLTSLLQDLDCCADYQNGYGLFVMCRETLHSDDQLRFGSFDLSLRSITYDRDRYRVRWVFNLTEVPGEWGETAPWWNAVGGERPWIKSWEE